MRFAILATTLFSLYGTCIADDGPGKSGKCKRILPLRIVVCVHLFVRLLIKRLHSEKATSTVLTKTSYIDEASEQHTRVSEQHEDTISQHVGPMYHLFGIVAQYTFVHTTQSLISHARFGDSEPHGTKV